MSGFNVNSHTANQLPQKIESDTPVPSAGVTPVQHTLDKTLNPSTPCTKEERADELQQAHASGWESTNESTITTFDLLPNELQHEIFIAAVSLFRNQMRPCLSSIAGLMLVAQRFYDWVLPCLYDTVSFSYSNDLFLRTIQSRPNSPSFFTKHVRKLCLPHYMSSNDAEHILSLCTDVVDLAFWIDYRSAFRGRSHAPLLFSLPLRRLHIEVKHFDSLFVDADRPAWLHTLTHLNLVYWDLDYPPDILHLSDLPSLTHLALNRLTPASLAKMLSICKQLKVIAVYGQSKPVPQSGWAVDSRVAFTTQSSDVLREWELQANDLEGNGWKRAEVMVGSDAE